MLRIVSSISGQAHLSENSLSKALGAACKNSGVEVDWLLDALRMYICDTSSPSSHSTDTFIQLLRSCALSGQRDIKSPSSALSYSQEYTERSLQASRVPSSVLSNRT